MYRLDERLALRAVRAAEDLALLRGDGGADEARSRMQAMARRFFALDLATPRIAPAPRLAAAPPAMAPSELRPLRT